MPTQLSKGQKIGIAVIGVAGLIVTVLIFYYLMTHPVVATRLRDISIILLALTLIIIDIAMMVLLWQVIRLLTFLVAELKPIMQSLQETTGTVRGTANFVSEGVASPVIEVSSKAAGAKGSLRFVLESVGIGAKKQPGAMTGLSQEPAAVSRPANAASQGAPETATVQREGV
jgi:hypothetical protein